MLDLLRQPIDVQGNVKYRLTWGDRNTPNHFTFDHVGTDGSFPSALIDALNMRPSAISGIDGFFTHRSGKDWGVLGLMDGQEARDIMGETAKYETDLAEGTVKPLDLIDIGDKAIVTFVGIGEFVTIEEPALIDMSTQAIEPDYAEVLE